MTHLEADKLFPAYQKGSLSREQVRAFHQHLKECEACQSRVRLQHSLGLSRQRQEELGLSDPQTQAAMARNRDLLVKLLLLLVLAWGVYKLGKR